MKTLLKKSVVNRTLTSAAEAGVDHGPLTARLKPCPSPRKSRVFEQPVKPCSSLGGARGGRGLGSAMAAQVPAQPVQVEVDDRGGEQGQHLADQQAADDAEAEDRKSTRLNSSHPSISYAVFCLKKKKEKK